MENKKLLILAGVNIHNKVVEAAREMGIYTIVSDYLPDSPAKALADEQLMYNIYDVDALSEWGEHNHIDGVINFCCDPATRPAQEIAERLHLPMFGTREQTHILTSKTAFKQFCIENGVDVIPQYTMADVESGTVVYPVIVKPTDSRGSRGVVVCHDIEEVRAAVENAASESSDGTVMIERYMGGHTDLTISYLIKDGQPTLVSLGDRYPGNKADNLDRQLSCTIQPSKHIQMYLDHVNDRVITMIKRLGIQNGPVFMQGFEDGDTVRMYDPGIRYPGNEYERIYHEATGIDLVKSIISYCVGGEILEYDKAANASYDLNGKCAMQYMINVAAGQIAQFNGLEEISQHENVIDVKQKHFIGDIIESTGDARHRAGEISILVDRDPERMAEVIRYIQSHLTILSTTGENMIISPFDTDIIYNNYGGEA